MADNGIQHLDSVLTTTARLMAGVGDGQRHLPTPCPDYDVDALRGHIADSADRFAGGEPAPTSDPVARYEAAADRMRARYSTPVDGEERRSPVGVLLMEFTLHGWDLARATGQDPAYDDAASEEAAQAGRAMMKPEYRGPDKAFGEEIAVPDDASPLDRLVGLMGRDPAWKP
jgi:uncharacterized protein (TIGR03086 family)